MKKDNIIDLLNYSHTEHTPLRQERGISDELQKAIQNLIDKLKEVGPLYSV